MRGTTAGVYNNRFVAVNKAGNSSHSIEAYGSFSPFTSHEHLRVGGTSPTRYDENIFVNCPTAVYTDTAMAVVIRGNNMRYNYAFLGNLQGTAISINRNVGFIDMTVDISNDSIINYGVGIQCYENNFCNTSIKDNAIVRTLGGTTNNGTGITMFCTPGSNGQPSNIGTNLVQTNMIVGMRYGVMANTMNGVVINNNWVYVRPIGSNQLSATGIYVVNCTGYSVTSNLVNRQNPTGPAVTNLNHGDIYVGNSPNGKVTCNITSKMGYSIQFAGSSTASATLYRNTMSDNVYGVWLSNGAIIGQQGSATSAPDNKWQTAMTWRCFTSGGTNGVNSKFFYRPAGGVYNPQPSGAAAGPNAPIPTQTTNSNPPVVLCAYILPPGSHHGLLAQIAQGQVVFPSNQQIATRLSKEGLYRQLKFDSSLIAGDSVLVNFKDSADQANIGKLTAAMEVYSGRAYSTPTAISSAYSTVTGIVPADNIEQHDKTIATILLNHAANGGTLTVAELDTLRAIAQLCPFTDGNAVYVARGLLAPYDPTIYENPCEFDGGSSNRMMNPDVEEDTTTASFNLYPNPSGGHATLEYQLGKGETGTLEIYSATGNLITSIQLSGGQQAQTISLPELDAGMYLYRVMVNGEMKLADRLVIIK